jgi:hypothetical protein
MVGIVMFESLTGSMLPFIPAADRDRPGQRFGTVRRNPRRRRGTGDLFHRRFHHPAGDAAVDTDKDHYGISAVGDHKSPPDRARGRAAGSAITAGGHSLADAVRQPLPLRGVVRQEPQMPNDRSNFAFFTLIAASLFAAVVLVALLIAGNVAGPRVAMNNVPPSQHGEGQ